MLRRTNSSRFRAENLRLEAGRWRRQKWFWRGSPFSSSDHLVGIGVGQETSPSWSPGNLRHSSCSPLVLLPSGSDTVRRTTMHRARAPCRARIGTQMAERAGFEPAVELPPHTLSKRAPSASRTPLQKPDPVKEDGGEEGIRTLGPRERSTVFETAPIDHSGTSPRSGPVFYDDWRCLAKKRRSSSRHR